MVVVLISSRTISRLRMNGNLDKKLCTYSHNFFGCCCRTFGKFLFFQTKAFPESSEVMLTLAHCRD